MGGREPASYYDGSSGEGPGLSGTEENTGDEEGDVAGGGAGEDGEGGPPEDDAGEDAAGAEFVGEGAGGDFEDTVGEGEDAGDPNPLDGVEVEIGLHAGTGDGDANAVEVSDGQEGDEEGDHAVAISLELGGHVRVSHSAGYGLLNGEGKTTVSGDSCRQAEVVQRVCGGPG